MDIVQHHFVILTILIYNAYETDEELVYRKTKLISKIEITS
jgi:hypothetical protein